MEEKKARLPWKYWLPALLVLIGIVVGVLFLLKACNKPPPPPPPPPPIQDLTITKDDDLDAPVERGQGIVYRLAYTNAGDTTATGIILTETVPAGTSFDATRSDAGWTCDAPAAGATCTLAVDSLAAGASGTAPFAVVVDRTLDLETIVNEARIAAADGVDATPDNNTARLATPVAPPPPPPPPPTPSAFCEVCADLLARGLVEAAWASSYRKQCALCSTSADAARLDEAADGYTLILASYSEQATAQDEAERFRRRFEGHVLPVAVLEGTAHRQTRYRVGLGHVATLDEAAALRARLAAHLPPDAWVLRLRAGS